MTAPHRQWDEFSRFRFGAQRLGISVEEYTAHRRAGERWCSGHKAWEQEALFGRRSNARDGLNSLCRLANNEMRAATWTGNRRGELTAYRQGATKLGISLEEYVGHVQLGERWCSGHRVWEDVELFGPHARRRDGLNSECREWSREKARRNMARLYAERKAKREAAA